MSDWTEQDERELAAYVKMDVSAAYPFGSTAYAKIFAREILRLRAERDREEQHHAAIRAENVKLRGEYADAIEAKFAELRSALLRSPSGTGSATWACVMCAACGHPSHAWDCYDCMRAGIVASPCVTPQRSKKQER